MPKLAFLTGEIDKNRLRRYTPWHTVWVGEYSYATYMRIDGSPAGQILKLLQQQGPLSIKEIEAALGVTTTAVRQQLVTLMTTGMVTAETVREKRGRPHAVYRLAEKGQELFAHGYEELALALLEEIL